MYIEFSPSIMFHLVFIRGRGGQGRKEWLVILRCHGKESYSGESVKWTSLETQSQAAVDTPESTSEAMKKHERLSLQPRRI